jgi:uncharacterized protein
VDIVTRIAHELSASPRSVAAAVALLDEGATVPFVARYRKEATGGLDDVQLRALDERLRYLRELEAERGRILEALREQGVLDAALEARILEADTKSRLDDLYLPYRKRRKTRADKAREAGLEPLLDALLADPRLDPERTAAAYVSPEHELPDAKAALEGARWILMDRFGLDADLVADLREWVRAHARVASKVIDGKQTEGARFRDWFDYAEPFANVPSHRAMALFRGRTDGVLEVGLQLPEFEGLAPPERRLARAFGIEDRGRPADAWLIAGVRLGWKAKLLTRIELALLTELRERAEEGAIHVFARNLRDLLLAAPAGAKITMGLDPGIRTGVKVVVIDPTGKLLDAATVYPFPPKRDEEGSLTTLAGLVRKHGVELIAIGNGTASRETDRLAIELINRLPSPRPTKVIVSEAGASVYSASEIGSEELPQLDVSLRGAVSIARRLQDPLAELVKIDPKAIGVGQYQHDVPQGALSRSLDGVVEDCVNAVGVDLNTASPALLARVSGLSTTLARHVVAWRDEHGAFRSRRQLLDVPRLGAKTFEQCAGFLRIRDGAEPLDATGVHPEAYPVVQRIQKQLGRPVAELMGNHAALRALRPEAFTDERFGLPTVRDILAELEKPGRDPRPRFETATLLEGVERLEDLVPGMITEGTVTNVTAFGAFVDIGVHQDGLVHISRLSDRFVRDPHEVVHAGQVVRVKVLEVDLPRKRVSLSMRMDDEPGQITKRGGSEPRPPKPDDRRGGPARGREHMGSLGDLLRRS